MASIKSIEELGYQVSFFKFTPEYAERFSYYMFDTDASPYADKWELIGVSLQKEPHWLLDLLLLDIEDDAAEPEQELKYEGFRAPYDAHSGSLFLWSDEKLSGLLQFLETLHEGVPEPKERDIVHFHRLNKKDMVDLYFDAWECENEQGNYYRYAPENGLQSEEKISLISFPDRKSRLFSFETFDRHRLQDPSFRPFLAEWGGQMRFTEDAWQEFLHLFKMYAYGNHPEVDSSV